MSRLSYMALTTYREPVPRVNISNALLIDGWMSEQELTWLAQQASKIVSGRIVEIGTYLGRSARAIADNMPNDVELYCIDPYISFNDPVIKINDEINEGDRLFAQAIVNVRGENLDNGAVNFRREKSVDASQMFADGEIDMVFIDGEHTYDSVKADINAWTRIVKPGGIICGHDYTTYPAVNRAVQDIFTFNQIYFPAGSIWAVTKRIV